MESAHPAIQSYQPLGSRRSRRYRPLATSLTTVGILIVSPMLAAVPAHAQISGQCLDSEWIRRVTHFVVQETGAQVPEVCVRFAGADELNALSLSAMAGRSHGETIAALYVPSTREILLAQDLDPASVLARSYLAHELVHAQQFERAAHERVSCLGALEGEAYDLQAEYLRTHSSTSEREAFLFQLLGMLQSACGYDY